MSSRGPAAAYSATGVRLFARYARRYFGRHFTALRVRKGTVPDPLPERCILYSNHPSWWDPMILLLLAGSVLDSRRIFAPIDAGGLDRYPLLRRLGLFPIETAGVAGTRRFLHESERLLADGHCLAVTAQGRFVDQRSRPPGLRRGIANLLSRGSARLAIPIAIEYSFWNHRLPEALISFGQPVEAGPDSTTEEVAARLEQALARELDLLQTISMSRDETRFETLVGRDRTDVNGIYAFLRRLRPGAGRLSSSDHLPARRR